MVEKRNCLFWVMDTCKFWWKTTQCSRFRIWRIFNHLSLFCN